MLRVYYIVMCMCSKFNYRSVANEKHVCPPCKNAVASPPTARRTPLPATTGMGKPPDGNVKMKQVEYGVTVNKSQEAKKGQKILHKCSCKQLCQQILKFC